MAAHIPACRLATLVLVTGLAAGSGCGPAEGRAQDAVGDEPRAATTPPDIEDAAHAALREPAGMVYDDVLTAGREIDVQAAVEGDVAVAGADVTVAGPVSGYVMSAGRNVAVQGAVGNDLWAAGETVNVAGQVGNNAMVAGRTVHLHADATVGQDANLAGSHVTSEGRIERDLRIGAASAEIGGEVGRTVEARAERVTVLPDAVIHGDLIVRSPVPPDISPQAQVLGQVRYEPSGRRGNGWVSWPLAWVFTFLALLVLGLAAVSFAPGWAARVAATLRERVGGSMLTGLLWLVLTPIAVALLLITVVGIPLAIELLAFYAAVLLLSAVLVAYRIGNWVLERGSQPSNTSPWLRMAMGVLIVSLGISLPFIGWAIALAIVLFGAGALILERRAAAAG
jgi:hypothetical protein